MNLELLLVGVGLAFLIWLGAFIYQLLQSPLRQRSVETKRYIPVNLLDHNDGVIVSEGRGHITYINDRVRNWFNFNGGEPNLSILAARTQPDDVFHDLFAREGRASFRVGLRRFQASSHAIPTLEGRQMVVFMRDCETIADEALLDPSSALVVVEKISRTVSSGLSLDQTLNLILNSISEVLSYSTGEITLWDSAVNALRQIGYVNDKSIPYNGGYESNTSYYYAIDEGYTGWIARYKQPLLLGDVTVRKDVVPKVDPFPYLSYIGVPLMVGDHFIGTLELADSGRYAFDHEDLALLEAIAGQAAIAIENTRLTTEQENRLVQLTGLQSIVQTMADIQDPQELYKTLHMRIADSMNVEICGILLFHEEANALVSQLPFHGVQDQVISLFRIPVPDGSIPYRVWQQDRWWYSNSVLKDGMVSALGMRGLVDAVGLLNAALAPMSVGNERIGMVFVANKQDGGSFNDDDMRLLSVFAAQATIVIENANLHEREQRYITELAGLQQMTQVAQSSAIDDLLSQITERIASLLEVEMCGVLFYDQNADPTENNIGVLIAQKPFYGIDEESLRFFQISVARKSIFESLQNEREYWMSNDLSREDWAGSTNFTDLTNLVGMHKVLFVPLTIGNEQLGMLQVANKIGGEDFTADDARVLSITAGQAAILIANVRLYRDVQRLDREAGGLRHIAQLAASHPTFDAIREDILQDIAELLDSEIVGIGLLENTTSNLVYNNDSFFGRTLEKPITIDIYGQEFDESPMMSRQTFRSIDVATDKRLLSPYKKLGQELQIQNLLIVPLIISQRVLGEIFVANKRYDTYNENDEKVLGVIAAQIAAAIDRTYLYNATDADLRARVEEQEVFDRINRELNETLLLDRILDVIRGEALRTTQVDDVSVVLISPHDDWESPDIPQIEKRIGGRSLFAEHSDNGVDGTNGATNGAIDKHLAPIELQMIEKQDIILIDDYLESPIDATPQSARSAIAQPIRFGDEIVGIIHLYTKSANNFMPSTVSFITRLGQHASLAVSNARRFQDQQRATERLRRRAHQVQQIFALSQMLREGASLAELMQEIVYSVSETVGFDKVTLYALDEQEQVFRLIAQAGLPLKVAEEAARRTRTYDDAVGLMDDRWKVSNSYFFPADRQEEWFSDDLELIPTDTQSLTGRGARGWQLDDLLIVPMLGSAGDIVGLFSVDDPVDGRRPDIDIIELLEVFATQAAFIIENFRLVENVQQEAEAARHERDRLAQLHLVSSEIQRAGDMSSRLQAVAEGIVAGGWERVQITLRDEQLEPTLLISTGYDDDEVSQNRTRLLPGNIWRDRFNDLAFHELKLGSAYYLRYDTPWVQKNILRGQPPSPRTISDDEWHPQDVLYLPLVGHDQKRIIGLIRMEDPVDGKRPTLDSLQPIELFALQAAAAIENTRLYNETVRQAETEQRLNELMEAMASTLDQTEIIRALATGLQPFVVFTRMHLALPVPDRKTGFEMTRVELTPDGKVHIFPDNVIPMENSAIAKIFQDSQPQVYNLMEFDTYQFTDLHNWSSEGERAVLLVPMIAGGDTLGVLRLGSELDQSFGFTDQQSLNLIQRMANLSAVSIQNSRLFTSLDETTSFNQAVVQSIQQGIVVLDNELRIRLVNAYMVRHYDWDADIVGRNLFSYRPEFRDFLEFSIHEALETGDEQHQYDVQDIDTDGQLVIRNFYTYPLRQGERVTGVVLLVEDITQRALLEADLSNRAEQLSALTQVSNRMTETLQPDQVVEVVLDALDTVIPYDGVALWLLDPTDEKRLQIVAARGFNDPGTSSVSDLINLKIDIADSELFREMSTKQVVVNAGDTTTGDDPRFPYAESRVYKNFLAVPLISKGEIIGVLQLEKKQADFYRQHHEQLVLAFANQSAVALNNAKLFAETQDRAEQLNSQAERLTLLNRVSVALSQSLDIENIFEITLRETAVALQVEEAAAIQINPDDEMCRVIIEYPRGDEEPSLVFGLSSSTVIQHIRDNLGSMIVESIDKSQFSEDIRELVKNPELKRALFVPLVMSGAVIGVMHFDSAREGARFTSEQLDLAQTLASQAAIAVQNASLYEQSLQRTYQLETLFEAGQSTAEALDVEDVMRRVATQMLIALQADVAQVMNWDTVENALVVEESKSAWNEEVMTDVRGTIYDLRKYKTRTKVLNDHNVEVLRLDDEDLDPEERTHMEEHSIYSRLFVPLVVNEVSIGLAQIDVQDKARYYEASQVRLIRTLANQAAIAIENARLQGETRAQIEELYLINDLSKAVSSTVDLSRLLEQVRFNLPMLTDAEYLYVALYDNEKQQISFPVAMSQDGDEIDIQPYPYNPKDEFGYVIEKHNALLLVGSNIPNVRRGIGLTDPMFPEAMSFLGVPMIAGGQVIGIIALRDDQDSRKFDFKDQRILTTVSSQLAVAIQNANLFKQMGEFAEELEQRVRERTKELDQERQRISTLYEIASEIAAATLDLDRVLNRTLESVSDAIGATSAIILAIDDISDNLYVMAQRGLDVKNEDERIQLRQNEGLAGWVIQNRQGIVLGDVQKDPRWITLSDRDRQPRSTVATLLESADGVRGVIMFYNENTYAFDEDHLRLVAAAASQLSNSMNSAELYGLIRDQAERLGAILRQEQVESTKNTAILNSVADGVMYANENGVIRVFNNTAERILNLSSDQVLNRHIRELTGIYGGHASGWTDEIENWMDDPTQHQTGEYVEKILSIDDGRVISVRLSPVNMGDQFLGTVSVFRDITRDVEVDRLKSEFVATVSHELRTPMTSIKGYADLLLLGAAGSMTEAQQRFLQTIKQNADRLTILVNDLLEVSNIDQGRMPLRFVSVDVSEIVQTTCNHLASRIKDENKTIKVNANVSDDIPHIRADYDKITQVLRNIADNAFDYTPEGGTVTFGAQYVPDDDAVIIMVEDTGIGMPENVRLRVFERFFRGDEYSEIVMNTPGTGLGLSIVRELVQMHNGTIWVNSTQDEGTTFFIKVPVATEDDTDPHLEEDEKRA
jgi:PAS domain S-box-containing protein